MYGIHDTRETAHWNVATGVSVFGAPVDRGLSGWVGGDRAAGSATDEIAVTPDTTDADADG